MKIITISEEVRDTEDFIYILQEIVNQINKGNTSGIDPNWDIEEVK